MIYDTRVGFLELKSLSLKDILESDEINKPIDYMKPLMSNATDRITINTNNYRLYFNKLLTSKGVKIQNDVLTKELFKANGLRLVSTLCGIIATCFLIHKYKSPETTVKAAGLVAAGASSILNRTNTLFRYGYGEVDGEPSAKHLTDELSLRRTPLKDGTSLMFHHEFMNKKIDT